MPRGIAKSGKKRVKRALDRRAHRPERIDENQFYSVPEVAAARDESTAVTWKEIKAGRLAVVRFGKRVKVYGAEIIRANREAARAS